MVSDEEWHQYALCWSLHENSRISKEKVAMCHFNVTSDKALCFNLFAENSTQIYNTRFRNSFLISRKAPEISKIVELALMRNMVGVGAND